MNAQTKLYLDFYNEFEKNNVTQEVLNFHELSILMSEPLANRDINKTFDVLNFLLFYPVDYEERKKLIWIFINKYLEVFKPFNAILN